MAKIILSLSLMITVLVVADTALAESYTWVDEAGTMHFTDDASTIPKKYRRKTKVRGSMENDGSYMPPVEDVKPKALPKAAPDPEIEKKARIKRETADLKEILKRTESDLKHRRDLLKYDRMEDEGITRSRAATVAKIQERRAALQQIEIMEKYAEEVKGRIAELER
jgi:hypothetical protein